MALAARAWTGPLSVACALVACALGALAACVSDPPPPRVIVPDGGGGGGGGAEAGAACDPACVQGACTAGACVCTPGWTGGVCDRRAVSCAEIRDASPGTNSGVFEVDPDGEGENAPFAVYCDLSTQDGGGWTKILQYKDAAYTPTRAAVGTIATSAVDGFAKLSDAQIALLRAADDGGATRVLRIRGSRAAVNAGYYVRLPAAVAFDDTKGSWGFGAAAYEGCAGTSYAGCTAWSGAGPDRWYLDSLHYWFVNSPDATAPGNNCDRYFLDYLPAADMQPATREPFCYPATAGVRCVSAGMLCKPADAPDGHPMHKDVTVWLR